MDNREFWKRSTKTLRSRLQRTVSLSCRTSKFFLFSVYYAATEDSLFFLFIRLLVNCKYLYKFITLKVYIYNYIILPNNLRFVLFFIFSSFRNDRIISRMPNRSIRNFDVYDISFLPFLFRFYLSIFIPRNLLFRSITRFNFRFYFVLFFLENL